MEIREALSPTQVDQLVDLYQGEWWSVGRERANVERMLEGSDLLFALVDPESDRLMGFARALTDHVYKALILDVIVRPEARGTALGKRRVRHEGG